MNKQLSMSFLHDELKEVSTHKKAFLEQIERIMPWRELEDLVKPCYCERTHGYRRILVWTQTAVSCTT